MRNSFCWGLSGAVPEENIQGALSYKPRSQPLTAIFLYEGLQALTLSVCSKKKCLQSLWVEPQQCEKKIHCGFLKMRKIRTQRSLHSYRYEGLTLVLVCGGSQPQSKGRGERTQARLQSQPQGRENSAGIQDRPHA